MTLIEFIDVFAEQFDETPKTYFTPSTQFKTLADWSSLTALSIIAMIDEEMGQSINSEVIKSSNTIEELFNKIPQ